MFPRYKAIRPTAHYFLVPTTTKCLWLDPKTKYLHKQLDVAARVVSIPTSYSGSTRFESLPARCVFLCCFLFMKFDKIVIICRFICVNVLMKFKSVSHELLYCTDLKPLA